MAEALYRKYRPQIFEDVVGQEPIERTIKNAIAQDKVSHAYLFTGPRGTGKTTTARLLAKALLCQQGPTDEPDGTCEDCLMIAEGVHPDVYELDAASRTGVDNVREEIISRVHFAPTRGRYKIYIIDEVHMLSTAAFNALLKTLEEPPDHVVFVLATTDPQKVPETIHSRCQRFDFHSIPTADIISRLSAICSEEDVDFEPEALEVVAHQAQGGMRNALTGLEQLIAFSEGKVTLSLAEAMFGSVTAEDLSSIMHAIGTRDAAACFRWVAEYAQSGADLATLVNELAGRVRNLYVLKIGGAGIALDVGERQREAMEQEVQLFDVDRLARLLSILGELIIELKTSTNARLSLEIALTRMVRPESDLTLEALAERVANLEQGTRVMGAVVPSGSEASGGVVPVAAPSAPMAGATMGAASASAASERAPIHDRRIEFSASSSKSDAPQPPQPTSAVPAGTVAPAGGSSYGVPAQVASGMPTASTPSVAPSAASAAPQPQVASVPSAPVAPAVNPAAIPAGYNLENPAALQRIWQSACSIMRQSQTPVGVYFLNTKVTYDAASGAVVILFPAQNDFVFKQAQKPEVQQAVAQAFNQAYGQPVQFRIEKLQAASAPMPSQAPTPAPSARFGGASQQGFPPNVPTPPAASVSQGTVAQPPVRQGSAPSHMPAVLGVSSAPVSAPISAPHPSASPAPVAYDDVPPWEEVPYGDEDLYPSDPNSASVPPAMDAPLNPSAPAAVPPVPPAVPAAPSVPPMPVSQPPMHTEVSSGFSSAGDNVGINEVQSMLAAAFGDGIVVEAVDDDA